MKVDGGRAILTFKHVGGGLVVKDGPLAGFAIAGDDREVKNAKAEIRGSEVIAWSPKVSRPVAVRYGWANYPLGNLWNSKSSDARLKTDVKRVGALDNGLPVYLYRYKNGGPFEIGLMAQDVEKVTPVAVTHVNGFKAVDYKMAVESL